MKIQISIKENNIARISTDIVSYDTYLMNKPIQASLQPSNITYLPAFGSAIGHIVITSGYSTSYSHNYNYGNYIYTGATNNIHPMTRTGDYERKICNIHIHNDPKKSCECLFSTIKFLDLYNIKILEIYREDITEIQVDMEKYNTIDEAYLEFVSYFKEENGKIDLLR